MHGHGTTLAAHWQRMVLGSEPKQSVRARRTLVAGLIYLLGAVFIMGAAYEGLTTPEAATLVLVYEAIGFCCFFLAIRTGYSRRFVDPSLTLPQILHGLGAVVLCYTLIPAGRCLTLPLLSLALTFALLSRLSPRQTMVCGLSATVMLVGAFAYAYLHRSDSINVLQEAINLIMAAMTLPIFASVSRQVKEWRDRLDKQKAQLAVLIEDLRVLATRDGLTGLVNRRCMNAAMLEEYLRFKRHGRSFCVAMIDIDFFKQINDGFGHHEGDVTLVKLARHVSRYCTTPDQVSRWGGEEFVVLIPECTLPHAHKTLDEMRAAFSCLAGAESAQPRQVTFSVGVASCHPDDDPSMVLARADAALYEAKAQGRNQVVAAWD